jgi:hypothetical protein
MDISGFLNSIAGLIVGLAALIAAVARLIHELKKWQSLKAKGDKLAQKPPISWLGILIITFSFAISAAIFGYRAMIAVPTNVKYTKQTWVAYDKSHYEIAVKYAEECINEFKGGADREQHKLEQENAPLPPIGKVPEQEKEKICERGLLNDVATCFYIKGRSLEALGQKQEAIVAHKEASEYTYARCWDPKTKTFWSPAEASLDRLQLLEK